MLCLWAYMLQGYPCPPPNMEVTSWMLHLPIRWWEVPIPQKQRCFCDKGGAMVIFSGLTHTSFNFIRRKKAKGPGNKTGRWQEAAHLGRAILCFPLRAWMEQSLYTCRSFHERPDIFVSPRRALAWKTGLSFFLKKKSPKREEDKIPGALSASKKNLFAGAPGFKTIPNSVLS